jgi:hypothetical protein
MLLDKVPSFGISDRLRQTAMALHVLANNGCYKTGGFGPAVAFTISQQSI